MYSTKLLTFLNSKTWKLERSIFDRRTDLRSAFDGTAKFVLDNAIWRYEETGDLQYGVDQFRMSRRYIYEIVGNEILVRFDDGRLFYSIDCNKLPVVTFEHFCDPDQYSGELAICGSDWKMQWTIKGPKKDLQIITIYK